MAWHKGCFTNVHLCYHSPQCTQDYNKGITWIYILDTGSWLSLPCFPLQCQALRQNGRCIFCLLCSAFFVHHPSVGKACSCMSHLDSGTATLHLGDKFKPVIKTRLILCENCDSPGAGGRWYWKYILHFVGWFGTSHAQRGLHVQAGVHQVNRASCTCQPHYRHTLQSLPGNSHVPRRYPQSFLPWSFLIHSCCPLKPIDRVMLCEQKNWWPVPFLCLLFTLDYPLLQRRWKNTSSESFLWNHKLFLWEYNESCAYQIWNKNLVANNI